MATDTKSLKAAYDLIVRLPSADFMRMDSYEVVSEVERYRKYWKPMKHVKKVLLSESHVRTDPSQFAYPLDIDKLSRLGLRSYPEHFVRYVYCLASGENELIKPQTVPARKNPSKWQFWEILWSCLHDPWVEDFPLTKKSTPETETRLAMKISLLKELQDRGIWLLEASIVGIDKMPRQYKTEMVRVSWDTFVRPMLLSMEPRPEHLVIIGKGVADSILTTSKHDGDRGLWEGMPYDVVHQPQSHLTANRRRKNLRRIYDACNDLCRH